MRISICVYVLVAIQTKELNLDYGLNEILQILSSTFYGQRQFFATLNAFGEREQKTLSHNQLTLIDI